MTDFLRGRKNKSPGDKGNATKANVRVRVRRQIVQIRSEHTGVGRVVPVTTPMQRPAKGTQFL